MRCKELTKKMVTYVCVASLALTGMATIDMPNVGAAEESQEESVELKTIGKEGNDTEFCKEYDIDGYNYMGWIPAGVSSDYKYLDMTYSGEESVFNEIRFVFEDNDANQSSAIWFASAQKDKFQTVDGTDVPVATAESQTVRIDLEKSGIDLTKGIKGLHMHVDGKGKFKIESAKLTKIKTVTDVVETKLPLKTIGKEGNDTEFCKEYDIDGYNYMGWIPAGVSSDYKYLDMTYSGEESAFNEIRFVFEDNDANQSSAIWFASAQKDKFQTVDGTDVPVATAESQTVRIDLEKSGIDLTKGIKGLHMHVDGKGKFKIENAELVKVSSGSEEITTTEPEVVTTKENKDTSDEIFLDGDEKGASAMIGTYTISTNPATNGGWKYLGFVTFKDQANSSFKYLKLTYTGDITFLRFEFHSKDGDTNAGPYWFDKEQDTHFVTVDGSDIPLIGDNTTIVIDLEKSGVDLSKYNDGIHMHVSRAADDTRPSYEIKITNAVLYGGKKTEAKPSESTSQVATTAKNNGTTASAKVTKPGKVTVKSATKKKSAKKATILLSKVKSANGYVVKISTSKKFTKKTTITKKSKSTKVVIKKLKKNKKYYVKARAYKKVNGKYYYSSKWSKVKAVKFKK